MQMRPSPTLTALAFLLLACGDDDERSPFESGVKQDERPAAALGEDERREYCRRLDAHVDVSVGFEQLQRFLCLPEALLLASSREVCEQRLDACVARASEPLRVRGDISAEPACFRSLESCQASVRELESCVNVNLSGVLDALERLTCAGFDDAETMGELRRWEDGASACVNLSASCEGATDVLVF